MTEESLLYKLFGCTFVLILTGIQKQKSTFQISVELQNCLRFGSGRVKKFGPMYTSLGD